MVELKDVTYVTNSFGNVALLASVLGCDGVKYACCGSSFISGYDPVLEQLGECKKIKGFSENFLTPAMMDATENWSWLQLYSYELPEEKVMYKPFTENDAGALASERSFVLVCTKESDMFAFAKFIERYEIPVKNAFVVMIKSFNRSEIEDKDDLMPFSEVMSNYVDDLNMGSWEDRKPCKHKRDLVWVQEQLKMTNVQFSMFFDVKLRTVENWRAKPDSIPDYAWRYIIMMCFNSQRYFEERYGSDVEAVLGAYAN